ncbi:MAG: Uma2 family endonuclease, partial [Pyrinomonadaceae bacterium]
ADLLKGLEPDGCFYIQNVETMRGVRDLDLKVHPPPDLVIEVDFSSPSIKKIPIYAILGVPEIWHLENDRLTFLTLTEGRYISRQASTALPGITAGDVTKFLIDSQTLKRPQWLRAVREWLRSLRK